MRIKEVYKLVLLMLTILISENDLYARQQASDSLNFSGRFIDGNSKGKYASIRISSDKNDWFTGAKGSDSIFKVWATTDSSGYFTFKLPNQRKPYKFVLIVRDQADEKIVHDLLLFAEPGDSVHIEIVRNNHKASVLFSGPGAEKYHIIYGIKNELYPEYSKELRSIRFDSIRDTVDLRFKMEELAKLIRKYEARKNTILDSSRIQTEIKNIIRHEFGVYNGSFTSEWAWMAELAYTNRLTKGIPVVEKPNYRKAVSAIYLRHRDEFSIVPDNAAKYSSVFRAKFASQIILEMMMRSNSQKVDLIALYDLVKANAYGLSKDVLDIQIGHILLNRKIQSKTMPVSIFQRDSLLKDASKLVSVSYVKRAIDGYIKELPLTYKTKVINAEFADLNGRAFKLESLKGKVFLIDNWFNGCFGCAGFHEGFDKLVYPKFSGNKNFVVLSVNIDREREKWLSGIESKSYTSREYINVTTGNWLDHPFLRYYNVKSNPWIMLVDAEGTVVYQPSRIILEELTAKINEALERIDKNLPNR